MEHLFKELAALATECRDYEHTVTVNDGIAAGAKLTRLCELAASLTAEQAPARLDLYVLHARLLPVAQAAGHEQLLLSEHVGQLDGATPYYEASCTGGRSGFRRYIDFFGHGSAPSHFERVLREMLAQQEAYLLTRLPHAA